MLCGAVREVGVAAVVSSQQCALGVLRCGSDGGCRLATLYRALYPPSRWVPTTPEHSLSGLHQAPAPRTHPLTPCLRPQPPPRARGDPAQVARIWGRRPCFAGGFRGAPPHASVAGLAARSLLTGRI